jgi:hypothetical protein
MAEPLTPDDLATMEQAARRFSGAYTGTSGSLAGFVLLLLADRKRLIHELAIAKRDNDK